ncbi:MAG TPA: hypothetical protein VF182_15570 [Candidatus Binatia bacterium]
MNDPVTNSDGSIQGLARLAFIAGAAGAVISVIGGLFDSAQFFRSYLVAYIFWLAIPLGSLAFLMLHFLVGGGWGVMIRRLLESATRTLPLLALLFVPLLFGLQAVYPWASPGHVAEDEILRQKSAYLNVPFFIARTILYLGLWGVLGYFLNRWSREQDTSAELPAGKRMRRLSGPGLLIYLFTMSFASVDWIMSIEPHWYSTIYGFIWIVNQGVAAMAFAIIGLAWLGAREPLATPLRPGHFQDLGNLLLAFIMLWAYMVFSQYLIIWSGNLAEEIPWYLARTAGLWRWLPPLLVIFHFFVPLFLLLMRDVKRDPNVLVWVAAGVLVMRLLDTYWMIVPGFENSALHWLDATLLLGIGGLWLGVFLWQLQKMPLLPLHVALLAEEANTHG